MIIIPAIDLKEGKCVRLRQGDMAQSTIFNESPEEQARIWADQGARRIHVVDLDGSVQGTPYNAPIIERIVNAARVPIQLGGGIRDEKTIRSYLDIGVDTVIMGTVAAVATEQVKAHMDLFPGKIAIAIDAKNGNVAISGWTEGTATTAGELAARFKDTKPAAFIYTDIERDGMMSGPNINATREFAKGANAGVILSGGVTKISDVKNAVFLKDVGVIGIIIGRALYERTIDLKEAIKVAEAV